MSLLILVLFIGLFMHDALTAGAARGSASFPLYTDISNAWLIVAVVGPKLIITLLYHLLTRKTIHALNRHALGSELRRLERRTSFLRQALIISYIADMLVFGALLRLRAVMGDLILLDELLIIGPPLVTTFCMWLSYYPIDARMREATFMSRMERGLPVQIWTRGQYLLAQVRHQWALIGLPLLILSGWSELVQQVFAHRVSEATQAVMLLGGSLTVFLFTPLIIRHIWDTTPLPDGEMRDRLMGMCKQHKVGVRELLLWRTFGGMINGAVMGLIKPLRFILLTDALLESMPAKQVEAVMAHELAHVRKHHMVWMVIIAAAAMELLRRLLEWCFTGLFSLITSGSSSSGDGGTLWAIARNPESASLLAVLLSLVGWFLIFGWVSRRFERQADTFAVQHLAHEWHRDNPTGINPQESMQAFTGPLPSPAEMVAAMERGESPDVIPIPIAPTPAGAIPQSAALTMAGALQSVADLNYIPVQRNSWRHGSIAWRQNYLRSLPGQPIDDTSIDRQVRQIKWAGLIALLVIIAIGSFGG